MIDYLIEPASIQDLDRLCEIDCVCFSTPWSRSSMKELVSNRTKYLCLVAAGTEMNQRMLFGYVGLLYVLDEGEIANIAVHPDWEGQGIGYSLIEDVKAFCREKKINTIHLEVRTGNASAIALYRKCGFVQTGRRKGYYADTGEDALLLAWKTCDNHGIVRMYYRIFHQVSKNVRNGIVLVDIEKTSPYTYF